MFAVSDKVVCVDDRKSPNPHAPWPNGLKQGIVYVISEVWECPHAISTGWLVDLVGFKKQYHPINPSVRIGFNPHRFRKLDDYLLCFHAE